MGFLPATGGRVRFAGEDITALEPHRRARLGTRLRAAGARDFPGPQRPSTICAWAAASDGRRRAARSSRRCWRIFRASSALLDRAGGALSGGEQQLLAIARCLCGKPRLVLLDEPTEGIQPSIIDEIVETLQRLRDKSGLTMILVEQNLDFIAALSQRILIIQKGTITREVQPGELADAKSGRGVHRHRGAEARCSGHDQRESSHGRQTTHISINCAPSPRISACTWARRS